MSSRRSAADGGVSVGIYFASIRTDPGATDRCWCGQRGAYSRPMRQYSVYILSSLSRTLYIGMTNDLPRRMGEHILGVDPGFTRQYRVTNLVYFEITTDVRSAISREKQLKRWPRWRKLRLIEIENPGWRDLSRGFSRHRVPSPATGEGE